MFEVVSTDYKKYMDGTNRRPSDPISGEEAENFLKYLFNKTTFKKLNELIRSKILNCQEGFPKVKENQMKYFYLELNDFLHTTNDKNTKLRAGAVAVEPQEDPAILFEINEAIRNRTPVPDFKRRLSIEIDNPKPVLHDIICKEFYSNTYIVIIDMTDPNHPKLDNVRFKYGGALMNISTNRPKSLVNVLIDSDKDVMIAIAKSLLTDNILRYKYSKFEIIGGNDMVEGQIARQFKPFSYLGDNSVYGFDNIDDYASTIFVNINSTYADSDKYNYTIANNRFNALPITVITTLKKTKNSKYSTFSHPNKLSSILCFVFFGRALLISKEDVYNSNGEIFDSDILRNMFYKKCKNAWGNDKLCDGYTSPLSLFTNDGFLNFTNVEGLSYIQDTFIKPGKGQATMKNNPKQAKPPIVDGKLEPEPQTKAIIQVSPDGQSIKQDGYNIKWESWSFNISFNIVRGVEISAIEYKFPKTEANQDEKYTRYANLIYVPHLYTIYTAANGQSATNFDDTGFYGTGKYIQNIIHGQDCNGEMLNIPVYKCWNQVKADKNKDIGPSNTWRSDNRGNFYPRDNLNIPFNDPEEERRYYAYQNMRGWAKGICVQEKDAGVIMKHHNVTKRGKNLHVTSFYTMNFYSYQFKYIFTQDGNIQVSIGASGLPLTKNPYGLINGISPIAADTTSLNHKHIYTVGIEPALNKQNKKTKNIVECVDKLRAGEVGIEVIAKKKQLTNLNSLCKFNKYCWKSGRTWYLSSYDNENNFTGSLNISSSGFTYILDTKQKQMKASYSDGYFPLTRTMWITPYSSDSTTMFQCGRGQVINRRLNDFTTFPNYPKNKCESLYKNNDNFRVFFNVALDHVVIKEHLPNQAMIIQSINITPSNVFGMNPLCLVAYDNNDAFKKDRGFKVTS